MTVLVWAVLALPARAQPEPWFGHPDSSVHYYHAVAVPGGIDWTNARDSAQVPGGYLATLTSLEESFFVFNLVDDPIYWYLRQGSGLNAGPWIGGWQRPGSPEPDSGWEWVSEEPFDFSNWTAGEPDDEGGNENALHFGELPAERVPTWDDLADSDTVVQAYVLELSADSTTLGLKKYNSSLSSNGYTLFGPQSARRVFLIDNKGRPVHSWPSTYLPVGGPVLLENGMLFRGANLNNPVFRNGGRVEMVDWDGDVVWGYDYSDSLRCHHHAAIALPNGNVLMLAFELKSREEAIAAGRDTAKLGQNRLWPEHLVEVDPLTDSIVWEWHLWDHLIQDFDSTKLNYGVVGDHPELVDLNFFLLSGERGKADWIHANSLDYNEQFDQIIISAHNFGEIWVIDHSTTTEEARGHTGGRHRMGGDIIYRWGNPWAYRRGDSTDQQLFGQHNAHWVREGLRGAGNIMVFDNGWGRLDTLKFSRVVEFIPTSGDSGIYPQPGPGERHGPDGPVWMYGETPVTGFYSRNGSGAQRLPNGNTLIAEQRNGRFFEVAADSEIVWVYVNPASDTFFYHQGDTVPFDARGEDRLNSVGRCPRYPPDYPGLVGRTLTPGYPLERYGEPVVGVEQQDPIPVPEIPRLSARPNPFLGQTRISLSPAAVPGTGLVVYGFDGRQVRRLPMAGQRLGAVWDGRDDDGNRVSAGVYYCRLESSGFQLSQKLVKTQ
ncbi:MAG: aryl-sulfate sulfotransferase [candidate division WOR-3 bacterium]|nr:MAG: aryl-sulfate sulfotransferase [candidate division WOR-3 bacterium]